MNRSVVSPRPRLAAFGADRLHKYVQMTVLAWPEGRFVPVLPFLDLGFVYNTGISFGLLGSLPFLVRDRRRHRRARSPWSSGGRDRTRRWSASALAICIGGALSNAVDRWLYGAVADFF